MAGSLFTSMGEESVPSVTSPVADLHWTMRTMHIDLHSCYTQANIHLQWCDV